MEERQALRLSGKCNKPIRPRPHKTGLQTSHGHSWECECMLCRPWLWDGDEKIDTDREDKKHKYVQKIEPSHPAEQPKGKGFPKPKRRWTDQRGRSSNWNMTTQKSSLTIYDRATPKQRAAIREFALSCPCPDCGARKGYPCRGVSGKVSKPHWVRRRDYVSVFDKITDLFMKEGERIAFRMAYGANPLYNILPKTKEPKPPTAKQIAARKRAEQRQRERHAKAVLSGKKIAITQEKYDQLTDYP